MGVSKKQNKRADVQVKYFIVIGYRCHLKKCTSSLKEDPEGCTSFKNQGVMSYRDQLRRDYPSFSQIRSVINQNSKSA